MEEFHAAGILLVELHNDWSEVQPTARVKEDASLLLAEYPLKASDALQLAAAIGWCGGSTAGRMFVCGDRKLRDAAEAEGFNVIRL